jgi:hypothetical protein
MSTISTHILDTSRGTPASGVAVLPVGDPGATIEVCVASRKGETSHLVGQFLDCVWETYPQPRRVTVTAVGA